MFAAADDYAKAKRKVRKKRGKVGLKQGDGQASDVRRKKRR